MKPYQQNTAYSRPTKPKLNCPLKQQNDIIRNKPKTFIQNCILPGTQYLALLIIN